MKLTVAAMLPLAIWSCSPASAQVLQQAQTAARIDLDGQVYINWRVVERLAGAPPGADAVLIAAAKIMIAVRDNKWKPFPKHYPRSRSR